MKINKSIQKIYIVDESNNSIPISNIYENKINDFGYLIGEKVGFLLADLRMFG